MKSWKTSVAGILAAIGVQCGSSATHSVAVFGQVCTSAGMLLLGLAARDNKVTSEQAGAK